MPPSQDTKRPAAQTRTGTHSRGHFFLALLLLAALGAQGLWHARTASQTTDETYYTASGFAMLRYADYRFMGEHPPLAMLWGNLPVLFIDPSFPRDLAPRLPNGGMNLSASGAMFLYQMGNDPKQILFLQRVMILFFLLLGGGVLYLWSNRLFGGTAGLASLLLYSFSANMLAHGSLFTTDMAVTCFYFTALYFLDRFFPQPSLKHAIQAGAVTGLALLSKMSAVLLLPVTLVLFIAYGRSPGTKLLPEFQTDHVEKVRTRLCAAALVLLAYVVSNKLIMPALGPLCLGALWFNRPAFIRAAIFRTRVLQTVLLLLWILSLVFVYKLSYKYPWHMPAAAGFWVILNFVFSNPVKPLGQKYAALFNRFSVLWFTAAGVVVLGFTDFPLKLVTFQPFDHFLQAFNGAAAHVMDNHEHCVEGSFVSCDWRYFFTLLPVKTSLITLSLFFAGSVVLVRSKIPVMTKWVLFTGPVLFLLIASFLNKINIGNRHILPIYPFFFLIAGACVYAIPGIRNRALRYGTSGLLAASLLFYAGRSLTLAPDYISYFSEWVGGPEQGSRLASDSNIDWGQDNDRLVDFLKKHKMSEVRGNWWAVNKDLLLHAGIRWTDEHGDGTTPLAPGFYIFGTEKFSYPNKSAEEITRRAKQRIPIGNTVLFFEIA